MQGKGSYVTAEGKTFSGKWKKNNFVQPERKNKKEKFLCIDLNNAIKAEA